MKRMTFMLGSLFAVCIIINAWADEPPAGEGIGGAKAALAARGIDAGIAYKFDVMSNTGGGSKTGTDTLDNLDVTAALDGEKLIGSPGTTALLYFLNNSGKRPGADLVGDAEGIDNIEVGSPGYRLYEAWVQQDLFQHRVSVLAGLYDLNSEFYITDASGLFLRSTFGIGTDIGQTGQNGPSIFPVTSAGVRVRVRPAPDFAVQAAALDGVPGNPNHARGTYVQFKHGYGALLVLEADYQPGGDGATDKLGLGAWEYTEGFDDLLDADNAGNPPQRRNNGVYVLGQHALYRSRTCDGCGLDAFARFGTASGAVNPFDAAWSAGLVATGLIPGREAGRLGLGIEGAHSSAKYRRAVNTADSATTAIELTYSDDLAPWFSVQPDVQYIVNPGADSTRKNATVAGARFTARF